MMWTFLKGHEGAVSRIYSDGKGIPTMGVGIALAVKGANGAFALRDVNAIGEEISGDAVNPYVFTPGERQLLAQVVNILNQPGLGEAERAIQAQQLIPAFVAGRNDQGNNKFGFTLSDDRMEALTLSKLVGYRTSALATVRSQAQLRNWLTADTDAYIAKLTFSNQEGALTSMRFNGVAAPKASGALLDGDIVTLRYEILYNSNPPSNGSSRGGIGRRRRDEADMATGNPATWSADAQAAWAKVEASPTAVAYRKALPSVFA
jgi:GH24 family phage-related lysozyme (muramidase)